MTLPTERRDPHPEDFCQRCGRPNIVWFAPNELWNRAVPDGGILCPVCFVQAAEANGMKPTAWCIVPERRSERRRAAMPAMLANVLEEVIGEEKLTRKGWLDLAALVTEQLEVWPRDPADPQREEGCSTQRDSPTA